MFSKNIGSLKCHRDDCLPCHNEKVKGPSLCSVKSVVYESVCQLCEAEHSSQPSLPHKGKYIGQTYRTAYERSQEHMASYRRQESSSFMFKHWATTHADNLSPPKFRFKVLKCHKDPLSRMIDEAILIRDFASMNSKAEFKSYRISRIKVDKPQWEERREIEEEELMNKEVEKDMCRLRAKTKTHLKGTNDLTVSRKRNMQRQDDLKLEVPVDEMISPIPKRVRKMQDATKKPATSKAVSKVERKEVVAGSVLS